VGTVAYVELPAVAGYPLREVLMIDTTKPQSPPVSDPRTEGGRDLLTETGVKLRFGIAPRSLQRWRLTGEGPPYVRVGERRILYRVVDIERWLDERTFSSAAAEIAKKGR
jgi:hypothetical protein